jgi:hypothetical protein
MYETILVTLDATPTDRAILEHVKTLAKIMGSRVVTNRSTLRSIQRPPTSCAAWTRTGLTKPARRTRSMRGLFKSKSARSTTITIGINTRAPTPRSTRSILDNSISGIEHTAMACRRQRATLIQSPR